jgi:hypothetical protein
MSMLRFSVSALALSFAQVALAGAGTLATNADGAGFELGGVSSFAIEGASPGRQVWLFISDSGAGPGACAPDSTCLDVRAWSPTVHGRIDGSGRKTFTFPTPVGRDGEVFCAQAATFIDGVLSKSNVVCETIGAQSGEIVSFEGGQYVFTPYVETFETAEILCAHLGMHIIVPNSIEEDMFLVQQLPLSNIFNLPWLGIDDRVIDGTFVDPWGLEQGYQNWSDGEPNGAESENCVNQWENGTWNDLDCGGGLAVVCELD